MTFRKFRRQLAALGSALAVLLIIVPGAASAVSGDGLRISPVRSDLTISPGKKQTITLYVTNVTAAPETLQALVNDFTANPDESGNPALLLNGRPNSGHSLIQFIQPISNLTLQPGQQAQVPVTIAVPPTAAGGGYYGAIRFIPPSATGTNATVTLAGSVGSLILVKVPGNIVDKVSIASFDVRKNDVASSFFTSNKNLDVVTRFQNEGNVQEEPFGKILLKNRSGKVLAEYEVNNSTPPGNVLPNSIRKFTVSLGNKVGSFGIFKLEGNFGYGSNGQLLSATTTFYIVPIIAVVIFIAIVLVLLFLIFVLPRLLRAYNQRIIRQASRRR
jgi:hypothetical protein